MLSRIQQDTETEVLPHLAAPSAGEEGHVAFPSTVASDSTTCCTCFVWAEGTARLPVGRIVVVVVVGIAAAVGIVAAAVVVVEFENVSDRVY